MFASPVLFDLFVRVLPRSRARARANGLYLNLSGAVKSFGCSAAGVGAKLRYSAVVLHGCFYYGAKSAWARQSVLASCKTLES